MAPNENRIYLISGTTRGIGRGLVTSLLQKPKSIVIAGVRDLKASTATSLRDLPKAEGGELILVKLDSASQTDALDAVKELKSKHGIEKLDVVIANAGIGQEKAAKTGDVDIEEVKKLFEVNTIGPLLLFQATREFLEAAKGRFFLTTSAIGSITMTPNIPFPTVGYGISKTAANHWVVKASAEYPDVTFTAVHPGLVDTELGQSAVGMINGAMQPITIDESVKGYLGLLEKSREELSGKFLGYDGGELAW